MVKKTILVTGPNEFKGFHLCNKLLSLGYNVIGISPVNELSVKDIAAERKKELNKNVNYKNYSEYSCDLDDYVKLNSIFAKICEKKRIDCVVHSEEYAKIRGSLTTPFEYERINNLGFLSLLESCKNNEIRTVVFCSSASVYWGNENIPSMETDPTNKPLSLYDASKLYSEMIAFTYSHLLGFNCTCLRLSTVYGTWSRPEMCFELFSKAIVENKEILLHNSGNMQRDFVHVSDVAEGIILAIENPLRYKIINLGSGRSIQVRRSIELLEKEFKKKAKIKNIPMLESEAEIGQIDISRAVKYLNYKPKISIEEGIHEYVQWFKKNNLKKRKLINM